MSINAVFVFYTLYISLTQRSKKISTIETAFNRSRHSVKYTLNGDTKMNPFTPKTDHYFNYLHSINTPTNMVSITIRENPNWRIIFY